MSAPLKTFVEFRSSKFPPYEGEDEEINPGLWGKRLAEYFLSELPKHGVKPEGVIAEDWGYFLPIESQGAAHALCCGHQYGGNDEFLCFTDPQQPVTRRMFKKIDTTQELQRLVNAVDQVPQDDPDISDIVWREP